MSIRERLRNRTNRKKQDERISNLDREGKALVRMGGNSLAGTTALAGLAGGAVSLASRMDERRFGSSPKRPMLREIAGVIRDGASTAKSSITYPPLGGIGLGTAAIGATMLGASLYAKHRREKERGRR